MATENFQKFVDRICALAKMSNPSEMYDRAVIEVDGIRFVIHEDEIAGPSDAAIYTDFGPLPQGPEREQVIYRLLDMNLTHFEYAMPYFAVDPMSDHVYMMARLPVNAERATAFLDGLAMYAAQAKDWQNSYFLVGVADENASRGKKNASLQERLMKRAGIS